MAGGSIRLFQFTQKYCQTFGIYPPDPKQNQYRLNAMNWFQLFCLNEYLTTTTAFLFFEANSMSEYGLTFLVCLSVVACNIYCLTAFWQAQNIPKFVGNWEEFIGRREHSMTVYENANEKIERLTQWFAYCFLASFLSNNTSALVYTYVSYYILDSGEESFLLSIPAWYPFDWQTPLGYFVAWLGQSAGSIAIMMIYTLFFCFFFGTSFLFICMAEDITKDLIAFNCALKTTENRVQLMDSFCAIIRIHSDAKQCVNEFNEAYELTLLSFFSWGILAISSSLVTLQFQLWDNDSKLMELSFTFVLIFWTFGLIFLICEPGKRVTDQFELFGKELERCDWHLLPINMQRMFVIFLSNIQQSVHIRSYGDIKCSRELFKEIISKGFSYFITLRQFDI